MIYITRGRVQDSPEEWTPTVRRAEYDFAKFFKKLHETEKILPLPFSRSAKVNSGIQGISKLVHSKK